MQEGIETLAEYRPNFIEVDTIEEANKVNLNYYRFIERLSGHTGKFTFIRRANIQR